MTDHVLVVDDDRDAADALAALVRAHGYEAKAVYTGRDAIEQAAVFSPDMALVDIGMPGLDGYSTVAQIRQLRGAAHVILVAVTGHTGNEDKRRAYEAGFDLHIAKPMPLERLRECLALLNPPSPEG